MFCLDKLLLDEKDKSSLLSRDKFCRHVQSLNVIVVYFVLYSIRVLMSGSFVCVWWGFFFKKEGMYLM